MRFPIDVVFLSPDGTVTKTEPDLESFRFSAGGPGSHSVVELPTGFIARHQLSVGDQLEFATTDEIAEPMNTRGFHLPQFWRRQKGQTGFAGTLAGFAGRASDALSIPLIAFLLGVGLGLIGLVQPPMRLGRLIARVAGQRLSGLANRPGRKPQPTAVSGGLGSIYDLATNPGERQSPRAAPTGTILMVSGPEFIRSFQLGDQPGTIGAAPSSSVHLPAAPGVAGDHARFWWRDRQLMLHHVATDQVTRVNGNQIVWTSLEEGDEVWIGPYLVEISRIAQDESVPGRQDRFARVS
jgi:hypothetical protein